MRKNRILVARLGVCALYSILQENPVAKLVSDPWFCAAVISQVGHRVHFIHQFSAGLAALESLLASCAVHWA